MRKRKLLFALLSSLLFFLLLSPGAIAVIEEEDWFNPGELGEFVKFFQEINYEFSTEHADTDEKYHTTVSFVVEGTETINGDELNRISINSVSDEDEFTFLLWADEEGEVKRVVDKQSDEEIPAMFANLMAQAVLLPFISIDAMDTKTAIAGEYEGYVVEHQETKQETIGELNTTVHVFSLEHHDDEVFPGTATYWVADFDEFQMVVYFNLPEHPEPEIDSVKFKITDLSLF